MALFSLLSVRQTLWQYAYGKVTYAASSASQKAEADFRINQVSERVLTSGKWRGTLRRISIPIFGDYVTLPRELGTILGIKLISDSNCCCISQIYTKFHEFAHPFCGECSGATIAVSETAQTFVTPDPGFKLRVKSTVSEAKTITFHGGFDTDNDRYYDSASLTIINGAATTTREWNSLPMTGGIQKQVTTVPCELYSVDSAGTETLIAVYAPQEEIPNYKKYKIPNCNSQFTSALVLGKLGYVPAVLDSDIVIPSNLGALKIGLKALTSEDSEEDESAEKDWQRCYNILNNELSEAEGDNEFPVFKVESDFGAGSIPNLV